MTIGSTGESSATPLPAAPPAPDLSASVARWLAVADDQDEFALAIGLAAPIDDPDEQTRLFHARSLLATGDAAGVRRLLDDDGSQLLEAGPTTGWRQLLIGAARASLGDDGARSWLLRAAGALAGTAQGWLAASLVGLVHDQRGDRQSGDTAWRVLVDRYAILTPWIASRVVEAHVAARKAGPGRREVDVITTYAEACTTLEQLPHQVYQDSRPALATADGLEARGDAAGALVLLELLSRRNGVAPELGERIRHLTPTKAMRRHTLLVAAALLLVPIAWFLGPIGVGLSLAGAFGWRRVVRLPGLDRLDSRAMRAARQLRYDPNTGAATNGHPDGGWIGLALFLGALAGIGLAGGLVQTFSITSMPVQIWLWLVGLVGLPLIAAIATDRLLRVYRRRTTLSRRYLAERRAAEGMGSCQCWNAERMLDLAAHTYSSTHLVPLVAAELPNVTVEGRSAELRQCPELGVPWLLATVDAAGALLLLRGALPRVDDPSEESSGLYL